MRRFLAMWAMTAFAFATMASAAVYHVDYDSGDDSNPGTSAQAPWKHAPGDRAAQGNARSVKLSPGDVVKFKGGTIYRGSIRITDSGEPGKPIVYDGNSANDWGRGPAIIDGSTPLDGLKQCASPDDVFGNRNFRNIYWTTVPKGAAWNALNLHQGLTPLAWSQDPNPADPLFQERASEFHKTDVHFPQTSSNINVKAIGMGVNASRPLIAMFDGTKSSAIIEKFKGGAVEVTLKQPVTAVEISVTPQPNYVNPRKMSFHADGRQILEVELQYNAQTTEQKFKLPRPATFKQLVIRFHSSYPLERSPGTTYGAVQQIAAYDAAGKNVLGADRRSTLRNDKVFTQSDPSFYDNAILALYAQPNVVYYKPITGYDPATHTISFETLTHSQRPYETRGAFSIVNSPRFIDKPGEYALMTEPEKDGSHKLYVWPPDGKPENLTYSRFDSGMYVQQGSHLRIEGFWIRKQGRKSRPTGIAARGPADGLVIRNCKVSNIRGTSSALTTSRVNNVLVENCEILDNAGHMKGILLRDGANIVVRGCTLKRNSSTALDFYTVTNGVVQDCLLTENSGMHANGLTFYLGCKNILVERNVVREGNVGLTLQDGENMIIRNNIISGGYGSPAIGIWNNPFKNLVITNNVLLAPNPNNWAGALHKNEARDAMVVKNNVIDGISGGVLSTADMQHNIFLRLGPGLPASRLGKNLLVKNASAIFVNPLKHDYRLKAGSPAIDAGIALSTINAEDFLGVPRPQGRAIDIGPFEFVTGRAAGNNDWKPKQADPDSFKFTFDGYEIREPEAVVPVYEMKFRRRDDAPTISVKSVDFSAQGGDGELKTRDTHGGFILAWDNPGHWVEWTVETPKAGAYELCIEHSSQMNAVRQVLLNGAAIKGLESVQLPLTGGWTSFQKFGLPQPLMLKAGKNVIRFVNVSGSHNFRSLEFIPVIVD